MVHIGACGFTDWVSKCSESGAYHLPSALLPASLPENDGAVHLRRKEMIRWCRSQCIDCPSCRWISVSEENADCSLYRRCDTSALLTGNGHFVTLPVRSDEKSDERANERSGEGRRDDNERLAATDERLLSTAAARLERSTLSTQTPSEPFNGSTVAVVIVHATAESVDVVRGKWLPPTVPALFVGESDDISRNLWYVERQSELRRNWGVKYNHDADNRPLKAISLANRTLGPNFDWLAVGDACPAYAVLFSRLILDAHGSFWAGRTPTRRCPRAAPNNACAASRRIASAS